MKAAAVKITLKAQTKDVEALKRAAMSKVTTRQNVAECLKLPETKLRAQYEKTMKCSDYIEEYENAFVSTNYCKKRFCIRCNRIRTAALIDAYLPGLEKWKDKQFVTLTRRNVKKEELKNEIRELIDIVTAIQHQAKKKFLGEGSPTLKVCDVETRKVYNISNPDYKPAGINGLRKLEVTYNDKEDTYHPHFHFVVENREQAVYLRNSWLKRNPEHFIATQLPDGYLVSDAKTRLKLRTLSHNKIYIPNPSGASQKANDIRPATENSVKELFKYFAKLVNKTDKEGPDGQPFFEFFAEQMDHIFTCLVKVRVFQPVGALKAAPRPPKLTDGTEKGKFIRGNFWEETDWYYNEFEEIEEETGKTINHEEIKETKTVNIFGQTEIKRVKVITTEKETVKKNVWRGRFPLTGFKPNFYFREKAFTPLPDLPPPEKPVYVDLTIDYGSGPAPF